MALKLKKVKLLEILGKIRGGIMVEERAGVEIENPENEGKEVEG